MILRSHLEMLSGVALEAKSKVPPWVDTAYFGGSPRSCSVIPHDSPILSPESLAGICWLV